MKQLLRTGFLLVCACTFSSALWPPGTEVVYDYHAVLDAVTKYPIESTSQWSMKGTLVVQGGQDVTTLQLNDIKVSIYNGPKNHSSSVEETELPEDANQLLQPFILHFEDGKVADLSVKAGEDEWAINMKRGIAGLLQLNPEALHLPTAIITENGLYGNCKAEYSSRNSTNNTLSVVKAIDFDSCHVIRRESFCISGSSNMPVDILSVRHYTLESSGPNGEYMISHAEANGGVFFHPYRSQSETYYVLTGMELKLEKTGKIENALSVKGGGEKVGLKYVHPVEDVSQGRSRPSQEELISAVTKMLHQLGDSLDPPGLERDLKDLHEERIIHISYFLSLLNHTSLNQLYTDLSVGTSYQHETYRNLFLELLPLVGSQNAVLLIRDLVMGGTLKNDTAVELLTALPFSLRHPSENLLKDFEVILTLPEDSVLHNSAILSFASLVHRVCRSGCSVELQDKYVGKYLDLFTSSEDYEKQFLYLQALGNFKLKRVAQYFWPIVQGTDNKYSYYIRSVASWVISNTGYLDSEKTFELFWPVFSNHDEHLEMRVIALIMLTSSGVNDARLHLVMNFMLKETDPDLRHFWYTRLQSISRTSHPRYNHVSKLARKAVRFYPEPEVHQWSTGHYILDFLNPEQGFGSLGELYTVANPKTGGSSLMVLHFDSHVGTCSYVDYLLFLRVEGAGDLMKNLISKHKLSVDKILELLKEIHVPTIKSRPLHIELALRSQGQVIFTQYFNETSFSSLFQVLKNVQHLAKGGVHVNAQNIVVPSLLEDMGSTDVGTTAWLRVTHSWMTSLRANLTSGKPVLNQLDFRSYLNSQTSLTQYNPLLNIWHGVKRSVNLQLILPIDLQFSVEAVKDHIKFAVQHKPGAEAGVIAHVETVAVVLGSAAEDTVNSHCPTCLAYHVVNGDIDYLSNKVLAEVDVLGSELRLSLHECEHSYQKEDFLSALRYATKHQNSHMVPSLGALTTLMYLYDSAVLVPPSGSCGFLARFSPLVDEPTKVEVEITLNRTQKSSQLGGETTDYDVQMLVTSEPSSRWEVDVHYAPSKHRLTTNVSSENGHIGCVDIHAKFPEAIDEVSFIYDKNPHSAFVEIDAEWDSSNVQIKMGGEVTSEQQEHATDSSVWPYESCKNDLHDTEEWGEVYAPLTPACYEVARELATLRRYNFSITSSSLPSWLNFLPESNVSLQVDVPKDSRAVIVLNGYKKVLGLRESKKLQPLLINTHFPPLLQLATQLGSIGSCVVTSKSVWTVDGVHLDSHLTTCYSLAVADCSEWPQFALFVKKTDSKSNPLALKLYVGDNTVEILPHSHQTNITVNDEEVINPEQGYQHPLGESNYHFKVWKRSDGVVRIYLAVTHAWIEYYHHFATVTVPGLYRGTLCGLCGNFNRHTNDDTAQLYTIPCGA